MTFDEFGFIFVLNIGIFFIFVNVFCLINVVCFSVDKLYDVKWLGGNGFIIILLLFFLKFFIKGIRFLVLEFKVKILVFLLVVDNVNNGRILKVFLSICISFFVVLIM